MGELQLFYFPARLSNSILPVRFLQFSLLIFYQGLVQTVWILVDLQECESFMAGKSFADWMVPIWIKT